MYTGLSAIQQRCTDKMMVKRARMGVVKDIVQSLRDIETSSDGQSSQKATDLGGWGKRQPVTVSTRGLLHIERPVQIVGCHQVL
jgi:hypothetical protein